MYEDMLCNIVEKNENRQEFIEMKGNGECLFLLEIKIHFEV